MCIFCSPLPNSFNDDSEVCLFSKLPGKQVKELLEAKGVTNISKVNATLNVFCNDVFM